MSKHEVGIIRTVKKPKYLVLFNNVKFFTCTRSGSFAYQDISGTWSIGSIVKPEATKLLERDKVPENVLFAAVSEDGTRIAFLTQQTNICSITIVDLKGIVAVKELKKAGIVLAPAWSPDGQSLAYYYGKSESLQKDGFYLMLMRVIGIEMSDCVVSPPSQWTALSPTRSLPPRWSPDGKRIWFEGRFSNAISDQYAIIELGQIHTQPAPLGIWASEGNAFLSLEIMSNDSVRENKLVIMNSRNKSKRIVPVSIAYSIIDMTMSANLCAIAYTTKHNDLHIVDVESGKDEEVFAFTCAPKLIWVNTNEGNR